MPQRILREPGPLPPGAVYCGAGSRWANPFDARKIGHAEAANRFAQLMRLAAGHASGPVPLEISKWAARGRWFLRQMPRLQGHDLADWIPVDVPSHVDTLLALANREESRNADHSA